MRAPKAMVVLFATFALTGCWKAEQIPGLIDCLTFEKIGGTLFSNPDLLTKIGRAHV